MMKLYRYKMHPQSLYHRESIFDIEVRNYMSDRVGAVRIMKFKAAGQRCRPFVRTPCVFERGIKPLIVKKFIGDGQNGKRWNSPRQ